MLGKDEIIGWMPRQITNVVYQCAPLLYECAHHFTMLTMSQLIILKCTAS